MSRNPKLSNKPKRATPLHRQVADAWWYENDKSIDVLVELRAADGSHLETGGARVYYRHLVPALKRAGILR